MAGFTLEDLESFYDAAKAAYLVAVNSQSYSLGGRSMSRQKIEDLKKDMNDWNDKIKEYQESSEGGLITSQMTIIDT